MNTIIHKANERGNVNHGWLKANHSFSFANYYDPNKEQFGTLLVLNDDIVEAGYGFRYASTQQHGNCNYSIKRCVET
jgi:redox-sensitive bicupin YhaK (pirin superfamily)